MSANNEDLKKVTQRRRPHGPGARMMPGEKAKDFKGSIGKLVRFMGQFKAALVLAIIFAIGSAAFNIVGPKVLSQATTELFEGLVAKVGGTGGIDFDAIAGIIAMRPQTIVFDEPTAMLDPDGRAEVISTMLRLNREEGLTVVNITHFMEEAVLADRVVVMDDGDIVMEGTPREIFTQVEALRALHLDVPQVTEIAVRLHEKYPFIPRDVLTIDEMVDVLCH